MALPNVDKMPLKDLLELEVRVRNAIVKAKDREKNELKSKIDQLAQSAGISVSELYNIGRGRQPRWLAAKLSKGGKLADFAI